MTIEINSMTERIKDKYLYETGIHEACHFVVAVCLGYTSGHLSISIKGGMVSGIREGSAASTDAKGIANQMMIFLAGQAGDEIHAGKILPVTGSRKDYQIVIETLTALGYSEKQAWAMSESFKAKSKAILFKHWPCVERIARELLIKRELTYQQALSLL